MAEHGTRQHHQRRFDSRAKWDPISRLYEGLDWGIPPDYFFHKGGMLQLTRYAASKLGHSRRASVNCIVPGGFFNNQDPRFVERYCARTFLGRMANDSDLKGAIVFLAFRCRGIRHGGHARDRWRLHCEIIPGQVPAMDCPAARHHGCPIEVCTANERFRGHEASTSSHAWLDVR